MMQSLLSNIHAWDSRLCSRIFGWNGRRAMDLCMYYASRSGDGFLYAIIGIVILLFDTEVGQEYVPAGLAAFAMELPLFKLLKHKVRRDRPFERIAGMRYLIKPPDRFSFPSGHTAAAFLMATLTSWFYPELSLPVFVWASTVGLSRVYSGVHYPTDVFAGMIGFEQGECIMESLLRWLISGYLVAMVCLGYLMVRSWMVAAVISAEPGMVAYQRNFKEGWLRMVVFSIAGSLIWSFIGAAIHHLLGSSESFIRFSLLMALLVTIALLLMRLENKADAIALNAIVVVGLGLLNSAMNS